MNIGRINSTPAFKSSDLPVAYREAETYDIIEAEDTYVSENKAKKKEPEEQLMKGVKAATISGVALKTGLTAGDAVAKKVENIAVQFCDDFSDDAAKKASEAITGKGPKAIFQKIKNFSTTSITELPKRSKSLIKWGIGAAIAGAIIYLGTKDGNNDGKSDLLMAIKTFINPATTEDSFDFEG